jgi:tRNA pseudouridine13 synthase
MFDIPEWPYYLGKPSAQGAIRSEAGDFVVEEIARIRPQGEGGHLWLWVEKRNANTDWVARQLAKAAGCAHRDVGYAGLKDRHAITRQWFSLPGGGSTLESLCQAEIEGVAVLGHDFHTRKLKRGTLEGNRFEIIIRGFEGDRGDIDRRLEKIRAQGVPNYFGPQRFGRNGQNVNRAVRLLGANARLPRNQRSIYLSAIRSFLFNAVLAERVRAGTWDGILDGELVMLDGSHSIFACEQVTPEIEDRAARLDIHPTGPLPGDNGSQPQGAAAVAEQAVLNKWQALTGVLQRQRVEASRRALRLHAAGLQWGFTGDNLKLSFRLPAGAYATTVLREILQVSDAAGGGTPDRIMSPDL